MKKIVFAFCIIYLISIGLIFSQEGKPTGKLGVVLVHKQTGVDDGEIISAVTTTFLDTRRFEVLEREMMERIMEEKDFEGFTQQKAVEFGQLAGLDLIAMVDYTTKTNTSKDGNISKFYNIRVRLVQVNTGQVVSTFASGFGSIMGAGISAAGNRFAEEVRETYKPIGMVVKVNGSDIIVNLGSEKGIKPGDVLEAFELGDFIRDPSSGEVIGQNETMTGTVTVKRVQAKISFCKAKRKNTISEGNLARFKRSKREFNPFKKR